MLIIISTFVPRECGIATFSRDLFNSINVLKGVVAMSDKKYNYGKEVVGEIREDRENDYIKMAQKLNENDGIRLIHIQHEFGIFGGEYGEYILNFLNEIKKPVVVTFHTVLSQPEEKRKEVVQKIAKKVKAIIVMNLESKDILEREYEIPKNTILYIPHGVPNVPFSDGEKEKKELKLEKNIILSTYGLISEGKGIEYFIQSLKDVIKIFPNVKYLILGKTHPVVKKRDGEKYRNFLKEEVNRLGLKKNVVFYNKYLNTKDIAYFLNATDVYLSPMLDPKQSASGTISFALGCGRPVISTSTSYAKNIIKENKGILVGFRDPKIISDAIIKMLNDLKMTKQMGLNAYTESRFMTWDNVALSHIEVYKKYVEIKIDYPKIKLDHLKRLTDDYGIVQFANNTLPNMNYGYSMDDNARALIVAVNEKEDKLADIYLNFIKKNQKEDGSFYNYINKDRIIENKEIAEDVQGRVLWALGKTLKGREFFNKALPYIKKIQSPRAKAFALLGLKSEQKLMKELADNLVELFLKGNKKKWKWFEDCLTYSSSRIPESLFFAYSNLGEKKYLEVAQKSTDFLISKTFSKDKYIPIGQDGWFLKDKRRALFDQQPEDPASIVELLVYAYEVTKKEEYREKAIIAFEWFLGKNHLKQVVYDDSTGGCYDGLGRYSLNINQGAESTVCYLMARQAIKKVAS
ncbi:MAG: glycosyltransferase [Candidatus Paceibacterota bacterium]|jgi:glycosyltransferase involved in cell wall biosynthesis